VAWIFFVQDKLGIGFSECCKETFYAIKHREFLGLLRDSIKIVLTRHIFMCYSFD